MAKNASVAQQIVRRRTRSELEMSLRKHLGFIQRSSDLYDAGHHSEAERIAVSLRVLFHSTRASISIIRQLGMEGIEVLTSSDEHEQPISKHFFKLELVEGPLRLQAAPLLDKAGPFRTLALPKWWSSEPVFWFHDRIGSRKALVLSLANKDGAHVDSHLTWFDDAVRTHYDLTVNVERQSADGVTKKSKDYKVDNALHASVRQIAYEVMETPAFKELAT